MSFPECILDELILLFELLNQHRRVVCGFVDSFKLDKRKDSNDIPFLQLSFIESMPLLRSGALTRALTRAGVRFEDQEGQNNAGDANQQGLEGVTANLEGIFPDMTGIIQMDQDPHENEGIQVDGAAGAAAATISPATQFTPNEHIDLETLFNPTTPVANTQGQIFPNTPAPNKAIKGLVAAVEEAYAKTLAVNVAVMSCHQDLPDDRHVVSQRHVEKCHPDMSPTSLEMSSRNYGPTVMSA